MIIVVGSYGWLRLEMVSRNNVVSLAVRKSAPNMASSTNGRIFIMMTERISTTLFMGSKWFGEEDFEHEFWGQEGREIYHLTGELPNV